LKTDTLHLVTEFFALKCYSSISVGGVGGAEYQPILIRYPLCCYLSSFYSSACFGS